MPLSQQDVALDSWVLKESEASALLRGKTIANDEQDWTFYSTQKKPMAPKLAAKLAVAVPLGLIMGPVKA